MTLGAAIVAAGCGGGTAQAWQPASGPLMTPWAEDVSPDNAWPEYPRPQMVRPDWVNLNGLWQYAMQPQDTDRPETWEGEILVPFAVESALSGVMKALAPDQALWYRRAFEAPAGHAGRMLLHFGAVDWQCTVWVNGAEVGSHTGGYDPFSFDITDQIRPGENELVVKVLDPTDQGHQPRGKQVLRPHGIMYTAVSGIWQTVWLEPVPTQYIRGLKITPDVDRGVVVVDVDAPPGLAVAAIARSGGTTVARTRGRTGEPLELAIPNATLWTPDTPHLYELGVALRTEAGTDQVDSYFGMRSIKVGKDSAGVLRLLLNGEPVFQYGPLDQGWWPDGLYTPATDEAMKYDIEMTKQFGMNMARKHVKVECARWYYWCDMLGLLVWQDMPSGEAGRDDASKANYRTELKAMVDALHNHPSIVMWVPFNEGWGQHDTADVVAWMQAYDPTRPINEASGWHDRGSGDVSDSHSYPGPGMRPVEENRVVVLGEFGGLGMPVSGHTWQDEANWGYVSYEDAEALTDAYVDLLIAMRPLIGQGLSAAVYTQTSDVEIEVNGLLTYDRKVVKMDLDRIAEAASKLYLPPPAVTPLVPTSRNEPQEWRYSTEQPAQDWFASAFDDSTWTAGPGGFGTEGTPGTHVRTTWDTDQIWIRRSFELDAIPEQGEVQLEIHHDEDALVYLNGTLVKSLEGHTGSYRMSILSDEARSALQPGNNTLAIHCRQTGGGQYIDAGLTLLTEP
jgi:hypothetical protein